MVVNEISAGALFNVNGLVAFVTGGGSGIGLMLTKALALNGAEKVYIGGRRREVLEQAAKSIGPNVIPITCDVTSKDSLKAAAEFIEKDAGYLNLFVCNSGVGGPQPKQHTPEISLEEWAASNFDIPFEDYVKTFATNSAAVWYATMALLKLLDLGNKKQNLVQKSQVIVTSSIAGYNKKAPGGWAYGQSKAAATHAIKQLSTLLPQWNIRANGIAPGLFPSEMSAPIVNKFSDGSGNPGAVPKSMVPLERLGNEKDMAGTLLYLASQAGAYTNGDIIVLDGGRLGNFPSVN